MGVVPAHSHRRSFSEVGIGLSNVACAASPSLGGAFDAHPANAIASMIGAIRILIPFY